MSYLGFTKLMTQYCSHFKQPQILEIGVDRGQTTLPLYHNLLMMDRPFNYVAVDIKLDMCLLEQLKIFQGFKPLTSHVEAKPTEWNMHYLLGNSLKVLPAMVEAGWKFDLILIDGDHNYPTVTEELRYLTDISYPTSLVIFDDYNGRHNNSDTFYADYESHKSVDKFVKLQSVEGKAGANQAIDDWRVKHEEWLFCNEMPKVEPALLLGPGIATMNWTGGNRLHEADWNFEFRVLDRLVDAPK